MVKRTTAFVLLLLLGAPLSLWAAQVAAVADRDRLGAGESLQLQLRAQGSADGDPDLKPLEKDWEILNRSQSSQMQFVNGHFSRSRVISLSLMPRRSGELEIPALCFGADCSAPLPIQVSKETAATRTGAAPLLLEAEAQPLKALVGSQVLLTVRLLHRVDLAQASLSEPQPQGVETEIQQIGKDRSFETRRDGYLYEVVERRYALFPQQPGTLHLPKLRLDAQVASAAAGLDPFGHPLQQVRRFSAPLDIRVEPKPADLGGRTWLPARDLTLQDDWQQHPPPLRVGEPATRTLVLRAPGLPAAHLPELKIPVPAGWKSYPDQPARQDETDATGVIGTLQQKLALVPTRPGPVELPAIDLDWYDVATRQWRRAHLDPVKATVAPAAAGAVAAALPPATQPATALPLPQAASPDPSTRPAPQAQPTAAAPARSAAGFWPWLSLLLGLGWLLTLLLFWRQRRRQPSLPVRDQAGRACAGREKDALQVLWRATDRNDAKATREALLAWSRCRWPEAGHYDLERLGEILRRTAGGRTGGPGAGTLRRFRTSLAGGRLGRRGAQLAAAAGRRGATAGPAAALSGNRKRVLRIPRKWWRVARGGNGDPQREAEGMPGDRGEGHREKDALERFDDLSPFARSLARRAWPGLIS